LRILRGVEGKSWRRLEKKKGRRGWKRGREFERGSLGLLRCPVGREEVRFKKEREREREREKEGNERQRS